MLFEPMTPNRSVENASTCFSVMISSMDSYLKPTLIPDWSTGNTTIKKCLLLGSGVVLGTAGVLLYRARTYCTADLSKARIIFIKSTSDWDRHKKLFLDETHKSGVLGADCEWVSDAVSHMRHKVALIQLAPNESLCFVIQLSKLNSIPVELEEVLKNPEVAKVGVDVCEDAKKLVLDYGVTCSSCLDLRHMVLNTSRARYLAKRGLSLQKLSMDLVGIALDKSILLRRSNWEADILTEKEVLYAANDALASFLVAKKVALLKENCFLVLFRQSRLDAILMKHFGYLFDIAFKNFVNIADTVRAENDNKYEVKIKRKSRQAVRVSPYYDNCVLLAPDGEVLAGIKRKKALWYLNRGAATLVCEEPLTVRLFFEPKGRPILDKKYYTISKDNQCVVCGSRDELVRKNIVPTEYRSFFPSVMTEYNSHDVLLMCVDCHQRSNALNSRLREQLAQKCDAPLSEHKYVVNVKTAQLIRAAKALLKPTASQIPLPRLNELKKIIQRALNVDELSPELLKAIAMQDPRRFNENFRCHGLTVVEHFAANEGGILELEALWRKHFLETMKPAYLPPQWSVNHHRRSLAYEIGQWESEKAEEILKKIGLTRDYCEEIKAEVRLMAKGKTGSLSLEPHFSKQK
ncbi:exonuclease 3'-5' domain-containing protein 2-like [Varroa destructor]|uniref:3'-5' exonuclease domain-containing protein n=1 Tax=Varroa destructor TaxID=109461 RepID=A0A7M7J1D2_VARDE|nr:exonuclease 3'-5' domain-containing protein 2-like [Varroa destructor]